jgi:predicted nucleic acid-binding Zn ribbon protein
MKKTVTELAKDLEAHDRICSERSKNIELQFAGVNARLKRLEVIIMTTTGAIILLLTTVVIQGT